MASMSASDSEFCGRAPTVRALAALALLTAAYALNFMDRFALVGMAEPVMRDLHLSDGQMGLLVGFAFSLVYAALGLPVAALADRWGRVPVICLSLAFWSVMTMAASRSTGFLSLAAARVGVGVGEAGGTPPAHSLLARLFTRRWLAVAMAVYSTGSGIGLALGLAVGGALAASIGWRSALLVIGAPGVLLAVLLWAALPRAPDVGRVGSPVGSKASVGRLSAPLFVLAVAMGTASFGGFAALAWLPALGVRQHGGECGAALAAALGAGNMLGILAGGALGAFADRSAWLTLPRVSAAICLCTAALLVGACLTDRREAFVVLSGAMAFSNSLLLAPVMTEAQRLAPPERRAAASALVILFINTIGAGGGPWFAGALSDALGGAASLRWALACAAVAYVPAATLFLFLSRKERRHGE